MLPLVAFLPSPVDAPLYALEPVVQLKSYRRTPSPLPTEQEQIPTPLLRGSWCNSRLGSWTLRRARMVPCPRR
ncbi:hypothetical protein CC2G_005332 [Coprinopsis cinerea AmutBmut pab1-1]|nr:hypothetical protein CC2G_005332 [Coprinopsis cinerea AmutBmut pab1-1]